MNKAVFLLYWTSYPQHCSLYTAQVEIIDVFYDEDEGTKVVMWNTPEGEVTTYSIRISYYDTFL